MTSSRLKPLAPYAAAFGALGLLTALVIWLLRRDAVVALQASLAVGLLGLALSLLFNPGAVQTWLLGRQARYGSNVVIMVLALVLILYLVNDLVKKNPQRWDLTEDQANTLSQETLALIAAMPEPVRAIGFYSPDAVSSQTTAQTLLDRYRIESDDQITYEFHDPYQEPALVQQYGITQDGTVVMVMGDQREPINFVSEAEVSGALSRLLNPVERVVYYAIGSGERDFEQTDQQGYSQAAGLLEDQNYKLVPLNLAVTSTVPSDATALLVAGSQVPVTTEMVQVIKAYVDGGGKLIVLSDPPIQYNQPITVTEPLADYLRTDWGVDLGRDVVLATETALQGQAYVPVALDYGSHAITQDYQGIASLYNFARSVTLAGTQANPAITTSALVIAGDDAWGETTLDDASVQPAPDDADTPGPINLGVAGENSTTGARLVVFGDADFASNSLFNQGAGGRLFVAAVNWAALDEDLINITPRIPTTRTMVPLEALSLRLIAFVTVLLMPLAVLLLGAVVWYQRRRRA